MYNTFDNNEIDDTLVKDSKNICNNFKLRPYRTFDLKKIKIDIDDPNINKIRTYVNDIFIPSQLQKANISIGKNDQLIQEMSVEYHFTGMDRQISYTYPKFLLSLPELYEGELPFNKGESAMLEIKLRIKVQVERIEKKLLFFEERKTINVCNSILIIFSGYV